MAECTECGMPEGEALEGGPCDHRFPVEVDGGEYARANAEDALRSLLHDAYPAALAYLALALHEAPDCAFRLEAGGVVLEAGVPAVRAIVSDELARRFAKASARDGGGT